jgi:hypothetical protein
MTMELLQFGKLAYDLHVPQVSCAREECAAHGVLVAGFAALTLTTIHQLRKLAVSVPPISDLDSTA